MATVYLLRGSGNREPKAVFRADGLSRKNAAHFLEAIQQCTPSGKYDFSLEWSDALSVPHRLNRETEIERTNTNAAPNWMAQRNNRPLQRFLDDCERIVTRLREMTATLQTDAPRRVHDPMPDDDENWQPARWFETEYGIPASRLRQSAHRGLIEKREIKSANKAIRIRYSVSDARDLWREDMLPREA